MVDAKNEALAWWLYLLYMTLPEDGKTELITDASEIAEFYISRAEFNPPPASEPEELRLIYVQPGGTVNIGGGKHVSLAEAIELEEQNYQRRLAERNRAGG